VGERSGIGLVELSMLEALDSFGARSDRRPRRSVRVLQAVDTQIGLAPGYAYQLLVDLAQPWTLALPLVDGVGNFGSRGNDPPASRARRPMSAPTMSCPELPSGPAIIIGPGIIRSSARMRGSRWRM